MDVVEETARILESLGHRVEYAAPEFDGMALARCYLGLYFGEVSALMAKAKEQFGVADSDFEENAIRVAVENVPGVRTVEVHMGRLPAWAYGI